MPVPGSPGDGGYRSEQLSEVLARRLMEQRVVLLPGPLDDATVTRVSAELMTLDAEGDDPVTLRIDCGEASLAPALTVMDVIELMGVPVRALCLGQVGGGAVGVLAVCAHRAAMPSTRFSLTEPTTHMEAHVRNVAQWAELRAGERERFCERVGRAVGKAAEEVGADLERGRFFGAPEAVEYGLLDEVYRPDAEIRSLRGPARPGSGSGSSGSGSPGTAGPSRRTPPPTPTPMGFRPLR
ncbi:MAG TPA: ATP-dependent Clp protease proteolytic subunit [Acidimicrobiales bacterium]